MLSNLEQQQVLASIAAAEATTSGELRVHLEASCLIDPVARAVDLFYELGMQATKQRNGVLIYVAYESKNLAIIGDQGINNLVPADFWDSVRDIMVSNFKTGRISEGLCSAIAEAGRQLAQYFPPQANDQNELPNQISFG